RVRASVLRGQVPLTRQQLLGAAGEDVVLGVRVARVLHATVGLQTLPVDQTRSVVLVAVAALELAPAEGSVTGGNVYGDRLADVQDGTAGNQQHQHRAPPTHLLQSSPFGA